ncbi:hypothetical protein D9M69_623010 [compost metagenome]
MLADLPHQRGVDALTGHGVVQPSEHARGVLQFLQRRVARQAGAHRRDLRAQFLSGLAQQGQRFAVAGLAEQAEILAAQQPRRRGAVERGALEQPGAAQQAGDFLGRKRSGGRVHGKVRHVSRGG